MSDRDDSGNAWRVPPSEYLKRRPATHALAGKPSSQYVAMSDGCRLAVDVYVPQESAPGLRRGGSTPSKDGAQFPTIAIFTPYYRRFALSSPGADPSPNIAKYRDFFVPRGYAMVVVDVRGCGASFGRRDAFRSPKERGDYREIADWIVAQPWSSGAIGATGISYLGAASCFLASTGHPAVKAIAPLFAVHDTYSDHVFPGGIMCTTVTATYDDLVQALDQDLRGKLERYAYFSDPRFAGPQPVDEDRDGSLLRAAIDEHRDNFRMRDLAPEFAYREDPVAYDRELHSGACSPYWYLRPAGSGGSAPSKAAVAVYSISGWYDGSQFANGSIARFLTLAGPRDRLMLGPWDHGARGNGSPWRDAPEPQMPWLAEVLRFFDAYLAGMKTGIEDEAPIHYHMVRAEEWRSADRWPPAGKRSQWFLRADGSLSPESARGDSRVSYQSRFTTGTGNSTRYERLGAIAVAEFYRDWTGREQAMLSFTSEPFDREVELTGHAIVRLRMSSSEGDGAVFAYLSEVEAGDRARYITEGMLRMLHRATSEPPPEYRTAWPFHTYRRADARPMTPGVAEDLQFALLPISWRLARGSRLRLSIAGGDADHFAQVPHGRPPRFEFELGGCCLELPLT